MTASGSHTKEPLNEEADRYAYWTAPAFISIFSLIFFLKVLFLQIESMLPLK